MGTLLGIDFGTGGAKATLIDDEANVLAYAYREYPIHHPQPGWSEHDAENYWTVACELVQRVLLESSAGADSIRGIGVSSALPSLVLVDEALRPVAPGLNLMDRRATAEVAEIRERVGEARIEALTANRIEDHPALVNVVWFARHRPQVLARASKALTIDGFIAARLTGRATLNRSSAAFFGVAYNIREGRFDDGVLAAVGVDAALLPELVDCVEIVGTTTSAAASQTGLVAGIPVVGGQVDCNAGWIAGGAVEAGDVQLNLGTSGVLGVVHRNREYLSDPDGLRMVNIPYTTSPADTWSAVAVTTTGGQALRYLRDTIGQTEVQVAPSLGVSPYDLLTLEARDIAAGSEGLIVLPYLMGERSPIWDASARGVVFGLSLHHSRGHLVRAFLEGVAYALYHSFTVLQRTGLEVRQPLVFNEGGARSEVWRRVITDVFGMPSALLQQRIGAPLGDALLAGIGTGVFDGFDVARRNARLIEHLDPDETNHARYQEYFEIYREVSDAVSPAFGRLHRLSRTGPA
ncbi:FGGY-family carbohydrate kinase [Amnibacterium sp. CER49]|uniref:FGGY-family carbohydrate kinase n=1 Tax=Amnibacterium sp. CER49 TaxID=3039161 RepID=UPI002449D8E7|nr:FGGY-family carbohydrate kinase [Amnibacterium sp. CER49]MDH2442931.1 FGGY-family carbohydrate kinase [Amnibacterium sp. CER49]